MDGPQQQETPRQPGPRARAAPGRGWLGQGAWRSPRSRGHVSLCRPCTPGALAALGGPAAPREPRLVFQSRRAGIFSVPQISAMARRHAGCAGTASVPGGGSVGAEAPGETRRGHGGPGDGATKEPGARSPPPAPLGAGETFALQVCGGEKTMRNVKFPHKNRLAGWETCRILLEHWPGPHETGDRLT